MHVDESGCWIFDGAINEHGYGILFDNGKHVRAHRLTYEALVGPIADGSVLDHLCRVRRCVNPQHLEPVTNRENILRGEGAAARNNRKTVCVNGHSLENAHLQQGQFERVCVPCRRERTARYRARKREMAQGVAA